MLSDSEVLVRASDSEMVLSDAMVGCDDGEECGILECGVCLRLLVSESEKEDVFEGTWHKRRYGKGGREERDEVSKVAAQGANRR
jgi:hypothetical protein